MTRRVSTGSGSSSSSFAYPELGHELGKPYGRAALPAGGSPPDCEFFFEWWTSSSSTSFAGLAFFLFLGEFEKAAPCPVLG